MNLHSYDLDLLGWTAERQTEFQPYAADGLVPGRVAAQHRGAYVLYCEGGGNVVQISRSPPARDSRRR